MKWTWQNGAVAFFGLLAFGVLLLVMGYEAIKAAGAQEREDEILDSFSTGPQTSYAGETLVDAGAASWAAGYGPDGIISQGHAAGLPAHENLPGMNRGGL